MDNNISTNPSPVDGVKEAPTYSQTMQTLRERVAVANDYWAKMEARRAFEESLNPEPAPDDPIATERYQTAIADKSLDWKYLALYESFGIPKILSDRIARIRKEIKQDRKRAMEYGHIHTRWWLESMLKLVERHEALTNWVEKHADETIVCFSNDPTDLDSYGPGYTFLEAAGGIIRYRKHPEADTFKEHECKVSSFDDPTMWDYAAECPGSDRYYLAFLEKADAEKFLAVSQSNLWKDASPEERLQTVRDRRGGR